MLGGRDWKKRRFSTYTYAIKAGEELKLNFYRAKGATGPRPCLLVVHGGSWKSGSNKELPNVNRYFASVGYHVASINYRLAPKHRSPAPVEDVASALAWLRDRADVLGIQSDNFVLLGRSAGGQIVLASAYTLNDPGIRGVISFYGPTDMLYAWNDPHNQLVMRHRDVLTDFYGGTPKEVRTKYIEGSPAFFVNANTPPTLLVHGGLDQHVHDEESALLAEKLKVAGVPHYYLRIPWATHGCEYALQSPSGQLSVYAMERFIAAVTRR
jgi:acetyl esterase/lipase